MDIKTFGACVLASKPIYVEDFYNNQAKRIEFINYHECNYDWGTLYMLSVNHIGYQFSGQNKDDFYGSGWVSECKDRNHVKNGKLYLPLRTNDYAEMLYLEIIIHDFDTIEVFNYISGRKQDGVIFKRMKSEEPK